MALVSKRRYIRPREKKHKQYLCILVLYGRSTVSQTTLLSDRRFKEDAAYFETALPQKYWEYTECNDHKILRWARAEGPDSRRVRRVLKWAEESSGSISM